MPDPRTQSWREVLDGNPYYQRLSDEERDEAEGRAKWTVANLGHAGFLACADLASLACEQGLALEQARDEVATLRRRLDAIGALVGGAA